MAKEIVWTINAQYERKDIFDYWNFRNGSNLYSIKLNRLIINAINHISNFPKSGRLTDVINIRTVRIQYYLIIYEEKENTIYILSIWDGRQNPESLKKRLE